ncbi:MAG: LegC family aminotransferase [Saprospiraceae bacterium]
MIPLSIPHLAGNEWKYVKECLDTGWVSSAGAYVTQFENMVAEYVGAAHGVSCVNGTSGLHLAMHMLDVTQGDYIIVPNITFIASANSASYTYAEPIFMDVNPDTWQMDLDLLERFLDNDCLMKDGLCYRKDDLENPIKAIMPVHVLGNMCDMPKLMSIANKYNIYVVEDASESLGSYWKGQHSGTYGVMSIFSFNGNKIITTGGGGVIVTNDEAIAKRAKHLTTQAKADPQTYYHDEIGFNYRMVNVLAAIGVAQMEQFDGFLQKKKHIDAYYREHLSGVGDIRFQKVEDNVDPNCWLFTFSTSKQAEILKALNDAKIIARPFWMPMNQLPMFTDKLYVNEHDFSKKVHADSLSIPSSVGLMDEEMKEVVEVVKGVFG